MREEKPDQEKTKDELIAELAALREKERYFREMVEMTPSSIAIIQDGIIVFANPAAAQMYGHPSVEEMIGSRIFDHISKESLEQIRKRLGNAEKGNKNKLSEFYLQKKDGTPIASESSSVPIVYRGKFAVLVTGQDITERKNAEKALKQNELLFRNLINSFPHLIAYIGKDLRYIFVNKNYEQWFGIPLSEIIGKHISAVVGEDALKVAKHYIDMALSGEEVVYEAKMPMKDGSIRDYRAWYIPNKDETGNISGYFLMVEDISKQKRIAESLVQKETMYRALFDNMRSGVGVYEAINNGEDFIFKDFNKTAERIEEIDHNDVIGKKVTEVFPGVSASGVMDVLRGVWKTGEPVFFPSTLYEDPRLGKSWRENYIYKLPTGEVIAVYNDVTERINSEEIIKASLKEKETLLKEIHHRVKNNMAVISSMLSLQADAIGDDRIKDALRSSQYRIRSMALVHEKLYQSPNLSEINFADYIYSIVNSIASFSNPNNKDIKVSVQADNVLLGIDMAIPCGLIINELLTNAYKYAFMDQKGGNISVLLDKITMEDKPFYRLEITDNGVGLPSHVDFHNPTSFGLKLVQLLNHQLQGTIEVKKDNGNTIILLFPA